MLLLTGRLIHFSENGFQIFVKIVPVAKQLGSLLLFHPLPPPNLALEQVDNMAVPGPLRQIRNEGTLLLVDLLHSSHDLEDVLLDPLRREATPV